MENKVYGYIYLITNLINGKKYIGQTIETIQIRFSKHITESKDKNTTMAIARAIKKYGIENFKIEQIDVAYDQIELNLLEGVYMSWFNSFTPIGYNIIKIVNGRGRLSEETKEKMRQKAFVIQSGIHNRGKSYKNSKSKYCGVCLSGKKWVAKCYINNKLIHLGSYLTEEEAGKAHDIAEIKINQNAILNFPELREQYINNEIIINKYKKKSNSNITGVNFCNTYNKWVYRKYKNRKPIINRLFNTKEEAENYAKSLLN